MMVQSHNSINGSILHSLVSLRSSLDESIASMAAQAELDRYIRENEISLYSINQSKLRRNPLSESKQIHELSFSVATFGNSKILCTNLNSTEHTLEHFIARLKQMQQFRVSQLQKVNALFNYDMELQDQMDLNMKTTEEVEQMYENEDFEAFLLGLTEKGASEKEKEKENSDPVPAEVTHSTMFTKRKPPTVGSTASDSAPSIATEANTTATPTSNTSIHNDLLAHVDDTSVLQLQRSRLERSARLKTITATIHAMGQLKAHSAADVSPVAVQSTLARAYTGSAAGQYEAAKASPAAGTGEPRWRQLPPRTPRGEAFRPVPTRPPPREAELRSIDQPSYRDPVSSFSSSIESKEHELPPPPPPPPRPQSMPAPVIAQPGSLTTAQAVYEPAQDAQDALHALTLQAIADGDLYLSSSSSSAAVATNCSEPRADVPISHHLEGSSAWFAGDTPRSSRDIPAAAAAAAVSARASKKVPKPFLVNNAHRKAVNSDGSADEITQSCHDPNLSLSTIAARSYASESGGSGSGSGSELSEVEKDGFLEHLGVNGIGFGRRYGASASTHRRASQSRSGPLGGKQLHWDDANGGRDDSSVESASQLSTGQRSGRPGHSNGGIFDYMDALESPDPKRSARVRSTDGSAWADGAAQVRPCGADALSVAAEGAASSSMQLCNRAAEITTHASRYYQRRLHRLEHGSDPEDDLVQEELKSDMHHGSFVAASPERWDNTQDGSAYDSPTPKTPTFNPLFS